MSCRSAPPRPRVLFKSALESQKMVPTVRVLSCRQQGGRVWPGVLCTWISSGSAPGEQLSKTLTYQSWQLCAEQRSRERRVSPSEVGAGLGSRRSSFIPHIGCDGADG